jgi:hypothetical protein
MQYKPIENYYMENVILGRDSICSVNGSLFHAFTQTKNLLMTCIDFHYIYMIFKSF